MMQGYRDRNRHRAVLSRRSLLQTAALGGLGVVGAAIVGCKDDGAEGPIAGTSPAPEAEAVKYGGTLRVGMSGEATGSGTHDPHMGSGSGRYQYAYMVMDNLVMYDEQGRLDPGRSLAESWEYVEPTRLILHLRPDITFHDGSAFNAEVAAWNLERARSPEATSSRSDLVNLGRLEAAGDRDLVLTLNEPHAGLLHLLGDFGGYILSRKAAEGKDWREFDRHPVGTGPMRFKNWVSDVSITYERNRSYWRKDKQGRAMPYLDGIEIRFLPDDTTRVAALEAGEIDSIATPVTDVNRLNKNPRVQAVRFNGSGTPGFFINHGPKFPPCNDLRFRLALEKSWDRQSYIRTLLTGDEQEAAMIMTPPTFWWSDKIKGHSFDPAESRRLLDAIGLPQSERKVLGFPLGATLSQAEEFWQASAARAGIALQWLPPERNGFVRMYMNQGGDGPAAIFFATRALRVDPDATMTSTYSERGSHNLGGAPTPGVEALVAAGRRELDVDRRKAIYIELEQKARDNVYSYMPIAYTLLYHHLSPRVGGVGSYFLGDGKPRYADVWVS